MYNCIRKISCFYGQVSRLRSESNIRKKKASGFSGGIVLSVVLLVVAVFGAVSLVSSEISLHKLRKEKEQLEQQVAEKEAVNRELQELLDNGDYEDLLERAAREKFDYVYQDEQVITVQ